MAVNNFRQYFIDTLVELAGVKSGLAISPSEAVTLLSDSGANDHWLCGDLNEYLRVEFSEFEYAFSTLLHQVGVIPDAKVPAILIFQYCQNNDVPIDWKKIEGEDYDDEWAAEFDSFMTPQARAMSYLQTVFQMVCSNDIVMPNQLVKLPGINELLSQYRKRSVSDRNMPINKTWDGLLPLSDLFSSESLPAEPDTFFDQRYIDYLQRQRHALTEIHWRQFESLTAEYFKRIGYKVTLGPGRNDGGKDVVAAKACDAVGPELVYIQCKRLGSKYEVDIDTVKAFWTTVQDDKATRGIVATTSCLAAGARAYCDARQYQLRAAESEHVERWISQMASDG